MSETQLACDYLVVGAGAASIAFIDTLLTERPATKIVLVDRNPIPGGHWVDAYGYVKLHQPSIVYGVSSRQLEGNWMRLLLTKFTLPWNHRASKDEILEYYAAYVRDMVAAGNLQYFPNSEYRFPPPGECDDDENHRVHHFSSTDGSRYSVRVGIKLINGVLGECIIPSLRPVDFHVDDGVRMVTPNQIFDVHHRVDVDGTKHYVVLGCGKTAMDTVVFLQRDMRVRPHRISWIIPNDVWMLNRDGYGSPWSWHEALLEHDNDERMACLALERRGVFARLDADVYPTKFRFPVVGKDEIALMRRVTDIVRRGRVTRIAMRSDTGGIVVEFGSDEETWTPGDGAIDSTDLVFVHCTSPGPFNGNDQVDLFSSERTLSLNLLFPPPVPFSMSVLAYLESARMSNTLDMTFARQLLQSSKTETLVEQATCDESRETISDNEVLRRLIMDTAIQGGDLGKPFRIILNLGIILAIGNKDPMVAYRFLKENRLSNFSIPGSKVGVYEALGLLVERAKTFGLVPEDINMMQRLRMKLQVLEGK